MVVLAAYATDHGSTRGVAERIAGRLQLRGVGAEACAAADVLKVSRYEAVVLGSAIHGGKWLPEARQFADRNAALLRERPVWLSALLAGTLAEEGQHEQAATVARSITVPDGQPRALAAVARALVARGDARQARRAALSSVCRRTVDHGAGSGVVAGAIGAKCARRLVTSGFENVTKITMHFQN